jgi:hypothetical protein
VTEQFSVESLPVCGDTTLRNSQANPTRANQRPQLRVEPVLGYVSRRVVRERVLLREEIGDVVGAAQPKWDDVIDLERPLEEAGWEPIFSLDCVLFRPRESADPAGVEMG